MFFLIVLRWLEENSLVLMSNTYLECVLLMLEHGEGTLHVGELGLALTIRQPLLEACDVILPPLPLVPRLLDPDNQ